MGLRVARFTIAAVLIHAYASGADKPASIKPAEAKDHVGKRVTACGMIVEVQKAISRAGRSWVLNFDQPSPNASLAAYVPGNSIDNYFWNADKKYANQHVCATGFIRNYEGTIYLQILQPSDLKIVKEK
jgi:hypothetical protein